ncbi:MAG: arpA protein [Alphaproteobacteria bacterium]|nr:arpA protein [Alphaproteobacteria bacterium]
MNPGALVDLDRYPLADPELARSCKATLERDNVLLLHDFLRPGGRAAMAAEVMAGLPRSYRRDRTAMGIYTYGAPNAPAEHPALGPNRSAQAILAGDLIPEDGAIWSLFKWDALTAFVGAVTGCPKLYRSADPLASCTMTALGRGDQHGWHLDDNDFVVSLLLQEPESGGRFEVVSDVRTEAGIDFDRVAAALAGTSSDIVRPELRAGTLSVFRGQRALHRVSPVDGGRSRLIALFSYDRRPGMMFPREVHLGAFGRTLAA